MEYFQNCFNTQVSTQKIIQFNVMIKCLNTVKFGYTKLENNKLMFQYFYTLLYKLMWHSRRVKRVQRVG